ncbi:MAG: hypothetical protein WC408_04630 [Candidatus Micrarchaeia archaeon]
MDIGMHQAEIPISPETNRNVLDEFKKKFGKPNFSDAEIVNEIVNRRIAGCKKDAEDPNSLKSRSKGHVIETYLHEGSGLIKIRIRPE